MRGITPRFALELRMFGLTAIALHSKQSSCARKSQVSRCLGFLSGERAGTRHGIAMKQNRVGLVTCYNRRIVLVAAAVFMQS